MEASVQSHFSDSKVVGLLLPQPEGRYFLWTDNMGEQEDQTKI